MQRNGKKKLGAAFAAAGALTIAGGFLLDDPVAASPAGSAQVSGQGVLGAGENQGGAGVGAAPTDAASLPRTGSRGVDPGILLVLGGGLAVSGVLIVRYAADRP